MKNIIIIAVLAVGGYFAYTQFYLTAPEESTSTTAEAPIDEYIPPVPGECEGKGKNMQDAIYGYDIGRVSVAQLNFATRSFQSCLKDAGFSNSQINTTVDDMKASVMELNPGSSRGF